MKGSKSQAAMEYLMVIALVTALIVPASYVFYKNSRSSSDQISAGQIERMGNDIVDSAEVIYYLGAPSRQDIDAHMPEGVYNITIFSNWAVTPKMNEIVFFTNFGGRKSEKVFVCNVNINGSFAKWNWAPGAKKIRIEAIDDNIPYVNISFIR